MRERDDDGDGDSDGDGGWWGRHKVPPIGHGRATGCQKGGEKGILLSHPTQGKTERSSNKGVTNEPVHVDIGTTLSPRSRWPLE